jgi:L-lactate dehydrogenase complex protein LldF
MNTCPVYRRSGGHSYHHAVAGPIGAILAPGLDVKAFGDLPFASTLCGSCTFVCPVKIDIHDQLYKWRQVIVKEGLSSSSKKMGMNIMAGVLSRPWLFRSGGGIGRWLMRWIPAVVNNRWNPWFKQREMPEPPAATFHHWYKQNRQKHE